MQLQYSLLVLVLIMLVSAVMVGGLAGCSKPAPQGAAAGASNSTATVYTCPMHPKVQSSTPGKCPKCGMNLVKKG